MPSARAFALLTRASSGSSAELAWLALARPRVARFDHPLDLRVFQIRMDRQADLARAPRRSLFAVALQFECGLLHCFLIEGGDGIMLAANNLGALQVRRKIGLAIRCNQHREQVPAGLRPLRRAWHNQGV